MARLIFPIVLILVCLGLDSCGSSEELAVPSAEERFQHARELYEEGDLLEAINEFNVITLQHQGSTVADDAQFYLGECRFERGEYILASYEYQQLKRNMPASPLVPEGQYKLAMSYYELSPRSALDQQYTLKAIEEFQTLLDNYPGSDHAPEAEEKLRELTSRLAKKEYDTARLYETMEYFRAAIIYYDIVIERYHDTEYAPLSYLGKAEAQMDRNRLTEARRTILKFLDLFPDSVLRSRGERLLKGIEEKM